MHSCNRATAGGDWSLQWRHNGRDGVSNHQRLDCLLSRFFRTRSKKTSELRVTGLCEGNSPGTGEFPAQMASNAENVSIWWRHYELQHGLSIWAMLVQGVRDWLFSIRFSVAICVVPQAVAQSDRPTHCNAIINKCYGQTIPDGGIYAGFTGSDAQQRQQWTEFCS